MCVTQRNYLQLCYTCVEKTDRMQNNLFQSIKETPDPEETGSSPQPCCVDFIWTGHTQYFLYAAKSTNDLKNTLDGSH